MEDVGENAYYDISEQDESTDSITSPQSSDIKLNKRLRSKVWSDFIPTFVHGKVAGAECKRCYQVFNCSSSYGTGNLLKHQVKCTAAGTQKRPRLQEHTSLPSTQKSTALAGADPKQKKLPFFPSRQSKCLDTADAMPAQKLVFPDTRMEKNRTNQGVGQNGSHEEVAALEQKNIVSAPIVILNDTNKSHRELPYQNPTDTRHLNQDIDWKIVVQKNSSGYSPCMGIYQG
ncbi:hypothetical protein PR202_gb22741 [Eleusine coracana subsp. coracana]|uniref:BED-type domain-containing protein n=1 Tax=Eleusine coracana subsp. coracana TaxID=191504 RepID=A0AAV5FHD4_ELECO|nr:hypothetical protein PR202_gb22741 [Eleusine coracana subsp. coracana]